MMLAFLSTALLGALHQFIPVITTKRLRSNKLGWISLILFPTGAWLLAMGFFLNITAIVAIAGIILLGSIITVIVNLSSPLHGGNKGVSATGLKLSLGFLVIVALFGATYALDEKGVWFSLPGHLVMAHALFGLMGFLGISYMAVAEKLWPMFLLSHRNTDIRAKQAIYLTAIGVLLTSSAIAVQLPLLALIGGVILFLGIVAHLTSLFSYLHHKHRRLELLHAFILISALFLVIVVVLAVLQLFVAAGSMERSRLIAASIAAVASWLVLAVIGHMHKIIPFILFSLLRIKGIRMNKEGKPLSFSDLYNKNAARITLVAAVLATTLLTGGLLLTSPRLLGIAGILYVGVGTITFFNFTIGFCRVRLSR